MGRSTCRQRFARTAGHSAMMLFMPEVRIGTQDEFLRLAPEPEVGAPDRVVATLQLHGVTATRSVESLTGFPDLADFFRAMADDWRGWPEVRTWESLEGDLRMEARHQYGHVRLTVTVKNRGGPMVQSRLASKR